MKFVIRKLGSSGDTCTAVTEEELAGHLQSEFDDGFSVAVKTEEATEFVGNDLDAVMTAVQTESAKGIDELNLILIPRVEGG